MMVSCCRFLYRHRSSTRYLLIESSTTKRRTTVVVVVLLTPPPPHPPITDKSILDNKNCIAYVQIHISISVRCGRVTFTQLTITEPWQRINLWRINIPARSETLRHYSIDVGAPYYLTPPYSCHSSVSLYALFNASRLQTVVCCGHPSKLESMRVD